MAACRGHENIVRPLVEAGSAINVAPERPHPLIVAAMKGHDNIVKYIQANPAYKTPFNLDLAPLCAAIHGGSYPVLWNAEKQGQICVLGK
jgi:ankyrin repeat protein